MSRIIIAIFSIFISLVGYSQEFSPKSWDEIANNIASGHDDAVPILLQLKNDLETAPQWDGDAKETYLSTISLLIEYTSRRGWFKDEETFLKDAMRNFNQKDSVANSPYTRRLWVTMTRLQHDLGDPDALLMYGHQALRMYEDVQDYSFNYALLLHNIAMGYLLKKDYLSAKLYIDEAVYNFMILYEQYNLPWEWGTSFFNAQGMVEQELGNYDLAIEKFNKVIDSSSPEILASPYWLAVNNLSVIYTKLGRYNEAKALLESIPEEAPLNLLNFKNQNLVILDYFTNDIPCVGTHLQSHNNSQYLSALNVAKAFSETEREGFFKTWGPEMIYVNNLIANSYPESINEALEANLAARSIEMGISSTLRDLAKIDSTNLSQTLMLRRRELLSKDNSIEKRDSLKRDIIDIEKELLRTNPNTIQSIVNYVGSQIEIRKNLKNDEAIVLFCYVPEMKSPVEVKPFYGAYVILGNDPITKLVKLCDVDEVEDLFYNNNPSTEFISNLYNKENGATLYRMIWSPLDATLNNVKTIYYSTTGPLGQLNHEAFIDSNGERIGLVRDMRLISNPVRPNQDSIVNISGDIALFGSPSFNISVNNMAIASSKYDSYSGDGKMNMLALRGEILRDGWSLLPGTKEEIGFISSILSGSNQCAVKSYIGDDATEEAVKALSGNSPTILHIATHGFVISNQVQYDESVFAKSMTGISGKNEYMLWSGLILAGGNNTWTGKEIPYGVEDGILTSDEISRLDLSNTKLVVLSACETGRGHIDPVDGIWGLQRGFKLAGVQSILMTLWKIPDSTTAMFMETFYSELTKGHTPRESLHIAQKYLINNGASDPFYWAPFVILD